jgi:choice-of-anchor B domain-containing protein
MKPSHWIGGLVVIGLAGMGATPEIPAPSVLTSYGAEVAAGEHEVFVAEPDHVTRPGMVYVLGRDSSGGWTPRQTLAAENGSPQDGFGAAIAVDGDRLIVGAPGLDSGRGRVVVFSRDPDGRWHPTGEWQPPDRAMVGFGAELAIDGEWALVGAPLTGDGRGAVLPYRQTADGWVPGDPLPHPIDEDGTLFGFALALDGNRALVSAPIAENRSGAVFGFHVDDADAWHAAGALEATAVVPNTMFGVSLAADDGLLAVGAPFAGLLFGRVHLYREGATPGSWTEIGTVTPADGTRGGQFGVAVAVTEDTLWVGAPGMDAARGAVYRFAAEGETWIEAGKLVADDAASGDGFGAVVDAGGAFVVVGLPGDDYGYGSAVVFEPGPDGWTAADRGTSPVLALDAVRDQRVTCVDGRASAFPCDGVDLLAFVPLTDLGAMRGIELNDVWGWVDPASGREFALVGRTDGTAFVEITDPLRPVYLGELPMPEGTSVNRWRDIKVYADHAYIVADGAGAHGVQVFALAQLTTLTDPPVTFEATARYDDVFNAHNIAINEATGYAYVAGANGGGTTCGGGLHMLDLSEPAAPAFAGCFAHTGTGRSRTGYAHDAQCVVYAGPDTTYAGREICFGSNETALSIADVTDKDAPVAVSLAEYPNIRYAHQGWLTEDHRYFYLGDELDEIDGFAAGTRTLVFDVSDLDDPTLVLEHLADTPATDHNLYIRGTLMYQSHYQAGLRILDISDPTAPVQVASFDTFPYFEDGTTMDGTWSNYPFFPSGTIVVTGRREGLFVVARTGQPILP